HRLYFLDTRVAKFHHGTTLFTDNMVVLLIGVRTFIIVLVLAKLMSLNKPAFYQEVQSVIYGCPRSPGTVFLHVEKNVISIKVAVGTIHLFQYHKTLGRLALIVFFQIRPKNFLY